MWWESLSESVSVSTDFTDVALVIPGDEKDKKYDGVEESEEGDEDEKDENLTKHVNSVSDQNWDWELFRT